MLDFFEKYTGPLRRWLLISKTLLWHPTTFSTWIDSLGAEQPVKGAREYLLVGASLGAAIAYGAVYLLPIPLIGFAERGRVTGTQDFWTIVSCVAVGLTVIPGFRLFTRVSFSWRDALSYFAFVSGLFMPLSAHADHHRSQRNASGSQFAPFLAVIEEAHTFIPSAREGTTDDAVSLPVIRRIITEGRKFGTGLMLISQRPSRLDETIISQCNSYLILRLVNPRDQRFVRDIMENLSESDARMIPGFGPGQGIVSGQVVRFPLPVRIKMDTDLLHAEIGDEDFFEQAEDWRPDANAGVRNRLQASIQRVNVNRGREAQPVASDRRKVGADIWSMF